MALVGRERDEAIDAVAAEDPRRDGKPQRETLERLLALDVEPPLTQTRLGQLFMVSGTTIGRILKG